SDLYRSQTTPGGARYAHAKRMQSGILIYRDYAMSLTDSLPIAALPAGLENITEMIVGFVFVIVVLAVLAGVTEAIGFVFKRIAKGKSTQPSPAFQTKQSLATNVSAP